MVPTPSQQCSMKSLEPNHSRLGTWSHASHGVPALRKWFSTAARCVLTGRMPCDPTRPSIWTQSERKAKRKIRPIRRGKKYPEMS